MSSIERLPQESLMDYKYRILIEKSKGELDISWKEINELLHLGLNPDTIRKGTFFLPEYHDYIKSKNEDVGSEVEVYKYKETTEMKNDGSFQSDKLIAMSEEQVKDSNFLLEAHGFDSDKWDITNARSSIWNIGSEGKTLYSSKITVKPKTVGFDVEGFVKVVQQKATPFTTIPKTNGTRLLEIPLVDLHFGINSFTSYEEMLAEIVELIRSKTWDTIYIPIGNDLLHNNDFKGRTANGTIIEKVDMTKAWTDAFNFYSVIYKESLENANYVVSDYIAGNHDTEMSWALTKSLEVKFPQIKWDTSTKNKKIFKWKDIVIVSLHGDKGLNRVVDSLITKYRSDIVNAKVIEVQSGHLHNQRVQDKYGITIRTLPTNAVEDDWHEEMSFEGSVKTSQVFEFAEGKLKTIHHV